MSNVDSNYLFLYYINIKHYILQSYILISFHLSVLIALAVKYLLLIIHSSLIHNQFNSKRNIDISTKNASVHLCIIFKPLYIQDISILFSTLHLMKIISIFYFISSLIYSKLRFCSTFK